MLEESRLGLPGLLSPDFVEGDDGRPALALGNGTIRFTPVADGRGEGLGALDLVFVDAHHAFAAAGARDLLSDEHTITICGTRLNVV